MGENMKRHLFEENIQMPRKKKDIGIYYQGITNTDKKLSSHINKNGIQQKKKKKRLEIASFWHRCGEKGILIHFEMSCHLVRPVWKTV